MRTAIQAARDSSRTGSPESDAQRRGTARGRDDGRMRAHRHEVSAERRAEFDQRSGEDAYQWIARQIDMATPFEATWLYLLRSGDEQQRAAWDFHRAAVTARWSRTAVLVAVVGTVFNVALALIAVIFR